MKDIFNRLFNYLGLDEVTHEPKKITGGLLHQMYRVETSHQIYAVKVLNPSIMKRETALPNYILSEDFTVFAVNRGIRGVPAVQIKDYFIHYFEDSHFMIFHWTDGISGQNIEITLDVCTEMAKVLINLHQLEYREISESQAPKFVNWERLIPDSSMTDAWINDYLESYEQLKEYERMANKALLKFQPNIISHRDLDPKNTIWDNGMPILIDWEAAGPVNSNLELLDVALYWSKGGLNKKYFKEIIKVYSNEIDVDLNDLKQALYCILDGKLKWLEYNLKRAMNIECSDEEERKLGSKEVESTLRSIKSYVEHLPILADYIQELV